MSSIEFDDIELYKWVADVDMIGARAIRNAIKENRDAGLNSVYCINNRLVYEMPDGSIREISTEKSE